MVPFDIAWAAGLFEGEGCITPQRDGRTGYVQWRLLLESTDHDVLRRFQSVLGVGVIRDPVNTRGKPRWRWDVSARRPVFETLRLLRPLFGERRGARADECMADLAVRLKETH